MPTLHLGEKSRHFKQIQLLHRHRLTRLRNSNSNSETNKVSFPTDEIQDPHSTALQSLQETLTQNWSILLLQRRFFQSRASYVDFIPKTAVVEKFLAALWAYEKVLTHSALYDPQGTVEYDLKEFEARLFGAVEAMHSLGLPPLGNSSSSSSSSSLDSKQAPAAKPLAVRFGSVRGPVRTGWRCSREAEGWRANMRVLLDPGKGKLRVKEWEREALGMLIDGLVSVSFVDGDGEEARRVGLDEALPREVLDHFGGGGDVVFDMDALEVKDRREIKVKSGCEGGVAKIGGEDGDHAVVVSEQRTPIRLRLRSRKPGTELK